ncbi:hypothetical protein TNCV_4325551 [Trichonephila clavipes]|nr:hypothetical protein TNCV_4325551 [Trichonephila clavipes]
MSTPGSLFTPTPLGHEDNLEVRHQPRANALQHESIQRWDVVELESLGVSCYFRWMTSYMNGLVTEK